MKKLYRTERGASTGTYNINVKRTEAAHVQVFDVTKRGLILDRIHGTAFDDITGGLRAMTPDEAQQFAAESNAEQGWKVGDRVGGDYVELQG